MSPVLSSSSTPFSMLHAHWSSITTCVCSVRRRCSSVGGSRGNGAQYGCDPQRKGGRGGEGLGLDLSSVWFGLLGDVFAKRKRRQMRPTESNPRLHGREAKRWFQQRRGIIRSDFAREQMQRKLKQRKNKPQKPNDRAHTRRCVGAINLWQPDEEEQAAAESRWERSAGHVLHHPLLHTQRRDKRKTGHSQV